MEEKQAIGYSGKPPLCVLPIIGQIEGHALLPENQKTTKYEHLIPLLAEAEQDPRIEGLLLLLNTAGGDVEAGLALAELIAGMSKPSVSLVLGGGHSIGIPLAVSADRSFIVPSATMTLHPVRMTGLVIGVEQSFHYFRKMQDRIDAFICSHSHATRDSLRALMLNTDDLATDVGTVLSGQEAVDAGIIDAIGTLSDALSALHQAMDAKKPPADKAKGMGSK